MSFENISQEEYDRLVKNKNRIFDLTYKTQNESMNLEMIKIFMMK